MRSNVFILAQFRGGAGAWTLVAEPLIVMLFQDISLAHAFHLGGTQLAREPRWARIPSDSRFSVLPLGEAGLTDI